MTTRGRMKIDGVRVHGRRRVYVSWVLADAERMEWKKEFWARLVADTGQLQESFDDSVESAPGVSGDLVRERLAELLAEGPGRNPVTDVVAVLTSDYVALNTDRKELPSSGELAAFVDHVKANAKTDRVRIYFAPVDKPRWEAMHVRDVWVKDAGSVHRWLVRLREDRFKWPVESRAICSDQVADAVEMITNQPQAQEARP